MRAMRVLLYLVAAVALAVTVQLPTARGHEAAHHHGHHGHHHDEHEHDGHAHGHGGDGHGHAHGHHGHKHVEEAHAHEHQHHDHHHRGHNHVKEAHGHEHDHHDHDHHDHKHVEEAHAHGHEHHEHHGHHHHEHHDHHHDHKKTPASRGAAGQAIDRFSPRVWAEALFATALVGAAPVVVLLFVPLGRGSAEAQKPLLRVFLSFAAGGLMGDALLHLLPHSLPSGGHAHDHGHDHHGHDHHGHDHHGHDHHGHDHHGHAHSLADFAVWLYCLAGMMAFLMLEKFVRAQTGDGHGHSHGHSHGPRAAPQEEKPTPDGLRRRNVAGKKKSSDDEAPAANTATEDSKPSYEPARISAAGYLNLAADFSHNFTDGLAIGATFLRGSGWQTTVAMLLHEVPHEIGDFAILIQSGFTRRQAMLTQLGTALGAMAGTVLGLLIEGAGDSGSAWISPFTAGGFIYIACASVMPELLEDCSLKQSLQEGVAMCLGIGLMVVIALYE